MKKHLAKGFITALLVAVLMAVFAVSASAAGREITWTEGASINFADIQDGDVITVDGTVTVPSAITIPQGADSSNKVTVTIKGNPADGVDQLIPASTFTDGNMISFARGNAKLYLVDITLNGNLWVYNSETETYGLRSGAPENARLRAIYYGYTTGECYLQGNTVITGFYRNGDESNSGGAIQSGGTLDISGNTKIIGNYSGDSGIIYTYNTAKHYLRLSGNAEISHNTVKYWGGAIRSADFTETTISGNVTISDNIAGTGGAIYNSGSLTISENVKIIDNKANSGGAIYNKKGNNNNAILKINGGSISNNTAGYATTAGDGGAIYNYSGEVTISNGMISGNTVITRNYGGTAIFNRYAGAVIYIKGGLIGAHKDYPGSTPNTGSTAAVMNMATLEMSGGYVSGNINNNESGYGAGLRNENYDSRATMTISGGYITDNQSAANGAGVYTNGPVIITGGTIEGNHSDKSAAVYITSSAKVTIDSGTDEGGNPIPVNINNNTATKWAGGIYVSQDAVLEIKGVVNISGNSAGSYAGGGIYSNGTLYIGGDAKNGAAANNQIVISKNTSAGYAGGVYVGRNTTTIYDGVTIDNNTANTYGGGIAVAVDGSGSPQLVLNGGIISNNTATNNQGGGIYAVSGNVYLNGGTITGNQANISGGGIYNTVSISRSEGVTGTKVVISNNRIGEENDNKMTVTVGTTTYERRGGGIENNNTTSSFIMSNIEISGNYCPYYGGGIDNRGTMILTDSEVSDNTSAGSGAGIFNYNSLTLDSVLVKGNKTGTGVGAGIQTFSNSSFNSQVTIKGATQITGNIGTAGSGLNINNNNDGDIIPVIFDTGAIVIDGNYVKTQEDPDGTLGLEESNMHFAKNFATTTIQVIGDLTDSNIVFDLEALTLGGEYGTVLQIGTAGENAVLADAITNSNLGVATNVEGKIVFADAESIRVEFVDIDNQTIKEIEIADFGTYWLPKADVLATTAGKFVGILDAEQGGAFYTADEITHDIIVTTDEISGKTLTVITLDIQTEAGASVKLGETSGLRFFTKVDTAALGKLVDLGFSYQRGINLGKTSDTMTGNLIDGAALNAKSFDGWKGNQYYTAEDSNGMTYSTLEEGYSVYSVALNMGSDYYEQDYYYNGYIVLTFGEDTYTVKSDFVEQDHCRNAKYVANAYGEYLQEYGTWNENCYEGLTAEQYESLCTIAGATTFAPETAE